MKTPRRWPWVLAGVAIGLIYAAALGAWIVLATGHLPCKIFYKN